MLIFRRALVSSLLLVASGLGTPGLAQSTTTPVVATFSILGDIVQNVGGDRITLTTLVGPNGDGHVYSPTPTDARRIKDAKLVVANGLKFEGWIARLVRSSGTKARLVQAAKGVKTIEVDESSPAHDHGDHSHAGETDPHAWQSVANMKVYVANIRDALIAIDPASNEAYEANATAYLSKLNDLEREIRETLALPGHFERV